MCMYSLYSYLDVPNTVNESITNSMFKITLTVRHTVYNVHVHCTMYSVHARTVRTIHSQGRLKGGANQAIARGPRFCPCII